MSEVQLAMAPVPDDPDRPTPQTVEVPDTSVYVVYPTPSTIHVLFHKGIQEAQLYDREQGWDNLTGEKAEITGANISKARNTLAAWFLDETAGEWLWYVDTDTVIEPTTLPRLLCSAAVSGAKVLGALVVIADDKDGPIPTLYQYGVFAKGEVTRCLFDYPDDTVQQVAATGTGCLLVHRSVLEDVRRRHPDNPYPWFREDVVNGEWLSEDVYFTLLANSCGHPVFVDCTTPVGHARGKTVWYPGDIRTQRGFPPERTYVVLPVKDRLDLTADLVHQLRQQGGYDELLVVDNGSGALTKNWLASQDDLTVLPLPDAGIHEMWNAAAQLALEHSGQRRNVNVAFLNNDLRLGPRFLERLARALRSERNLVAVSGNYDGRPADGGLVQHTTDICANRYDGTGGFAGFAFMTTGEWLGTYRFPEECKWWFGDNDLVLAAQYAKGHVGLALEATVEHLDGGGGTAGDALWTKFQEQTERDRVAFEDRWRAVLGEQGVDPDASELARAYRAVCARPSDINEHLPTLVKVAERADARRVVELGTRTGVSTVAWLYALEQLTRAETGLTAVDCRHLWSVDLSEAPFEGPTNWTFVRGDDVDPATLKQLPGQVDVVFVDSLHTYDHTCREIETYVRRVRPGGALVFHDTNHEVFDEHVPLGYTSEPPFPVYQAVTEYFEPAEGEPIVPVAEVEHYENNHGLTVIWLAEAPPPASETGGVREPRPDPAPLPVLTEALAVPA